jgi:type IV secretion system protein VirD4
LTPGEVMQLPPDEEIVMAAGLAPIRGRKARYYQNPRFNARLLAPPTPQPLTPAERPKDDWTALPPIEPPKPVAAGKPTRTKKVAAKPARTSPPTTKAEDDGAAKGDPANAGIRQEPDLPDHEEIVAKPPVPRSEFEFNEGDEDMDTAGNRQIQERLSGAARQASLDPDDGIAM